MVENFGRSAAAAADHTRKSALAAGSIIFVLGVALAAIPFLDREAFAASAGWILLASGLAEMAADLHRRRLPEYRSLLLLPITAVGVGLALLLKSSIDFLTSLQLVIVSLVARAIGAIVAAFLAQPGTRGWILSRALVDSLLALVLVLAAPIAVLVVFLFGVDWSWKGTEALGLALGTSLAVAGGMWIGIANAERPPPSAGRR